MTARTFEFERNMRRESKYMLRSLIDQFIGNIENEYLKEYFDTIIDQVRRLNTGEGTYYDVDRNVYDSTIDIHNYDKIVFTTLSDTPMENYLELQRCIHGVIDVMENPPPPKENQWYALTNLIKKGYEDGVTEFRVYVTDENNFMIHPMDHDGDTLDLEM
jgi:hypothetical protein